MKLHVIRILFCVILMLSTSGCFLTKAVTVPMRVTGAAISVVPVVGNPIDG